MVVNLGEAPEEALDHLHRLLFEPHVPRTLVTGLTSWSGGDVQGVLLGGNVSLLAASVGTRDLPKPEGAIVLLEDVGQPQWVIDRALTQLIRAGWLSRAAGILLGDFSLDDDPARALQLARDNWNVQREPADLRILAEAAAATKDAAALQLVRDWLAETRLEYAAVDRLVNARSTT